MAQDEVHVVLDDEDGNARFIDQATEVGEDLHRQRAGDAGHGLVQQQKTGFAHHRAPDVHQLALTARELACKVVRHVRHFEFIEHVVGPRKPSLLCGVLASLPQHVKRPELVARRHEEVLDDRHLAPQTRVLEGSSDAKALNLLRTHGGGVFSEHLDAPSRLLEQPADAVERRRFPASIWPDQADHFALGHLEGDVLDRDEATELHAEAVHLQGHAHSSTSAVAAPGRSGRKGTSGSSPLALNFSENTMRRPTSTSLTKPIFGVTPPSTSGKTSVME